MFVYMHEWALLYLMVEQHEQYNSRLTEKPWCVAMAAESSLEAFKADVLKTVPSLSDCKTITWLAFYCLNSITPHTILCNYMYILQQVVRYMLIGYFFKMHVWSEVIFLNILSQSLLKRRLSRIKIMNWVKNKLDPGRLYQNSSSLPMKKEWN